MTKFDDSILKMYDVFSMFPLLENITDYDELNKKYDLISVWENELEKKFDGKSISNTYDKKTFMDSFFPIIHNYWAIFRLINNPDSLHQFFVEEDLHQMLRKTDVKLEYDKLPFPTIFINKKFIVDGCEIYGIFVTELLTKENKQSYTAFSMIKDEGILLCYSIAIEEENNVVCMIPSKNNVSQFMGEYVVSLLHYLHTPTANVVYNYPSKKILKNLQKKRTGIGGHHYVKLDGTVRIYLDKIKSSHGGEIDWFHKWWVRGHYRDLRSDVYVNKKGERIWIHPFIKGDGDLIKREYIMEKHD